MSQASSPDFDSVAGPPYEPFTRARGKRRGTNMMGDLAMVIVSFSIGFAIIALAMLLRNAPKR